MHGSEDEGALHKEEESAVLADAIGCECWDYPVQKLIYYLICDDHRE